MNQQALVLASIAFLTLLGRPAAADPGCSVKDIAGKWMFATSIGQQSLSDMLPPGKDLTALGTMNIERDGTLEGVFDFTVEDEFFFPDVPYSGTVVVNPDCTGTISFVTGAGSMRNDSIAIVNRREILAMSQDPANLWTYQIRRIAANLGRNDRD